MGGFPVSLTPFQPLSREPADLRAPFLRESLPARCREIFILRKIKGLSQKEIARELGLSEPNVQVQASRGLRRCAESLREHRMRNRFEP